MTALTTKLLLTAEQIAGNMVHLTPLALGLISVCQMARAASIEGKAQLITVRGFTQQQS